MSRSPTEPRGKWQNVQLLTRAVSVLDALSSCPVGCTLNALATTLELSKASLLRILRTFEDERLVRRDGDLYRLGTRVLDFSHSYLRGLELVDAAKPLMEALVAKTEQTVSLAILDGLEVVYVAIEHAQQEIGIQGEVGARHPAHATALGKVLLADLAPVDRRARLALHDLVRLTHRTIVDPAALERHLDGVQAHGFAVDDEERGIGIRCVAAPIRRGDGRVLAAMSVAGPIFHMTEEALPAVREELLHTVAEISESFGYRPPRLVRPQGEPPERSPRDPRSKRDRVVAPPRRS